MNIELTGGTIRFLSNDTVQLCATEHHYYHQSNRELSITLTIVMVAKTWITSEGEILGHTCIPPVQALCLVSMKFNKPYTVKEKFIIVLGLL